MLTALFINGIYQSVLDEIVVSQERRGGEESFLQPYKSKVIKMLQKQQPTSASPIRIYVSTTANLSQISYLAEIVLWEDKRELTSQRRSGVLKLLQMYQPGEVELFVGGEPQGVNAVNLITIRHLRALDTQFSTSILRKVTDGMPLKKRTRSGGWSEVYDPGELIELPPQTELSYLEELDKKIADSHRVSNKELEISLKNAQKMPAKIQIVSTGFRRNPDVIVAVLRRANGICERCKKPAPFIRRSDKTPYLEIHHKQPLSENGEDTVDNAVALCPNCHREVHYG